MTAPSRATDWRRHVPLVVRAPLAGAAALAAAGLALLPGRPAALTAGLAACVAFALAVRRLRSGRGGALACTTLAAAVGAAVLSQFVPALPTSPQSLTDAAAQLGRNWAALVEPLRDAVTDPPPAGSDYGWLGTRAASLGPRAGVALLDAAGGRAVAWAGWTTPLARDERAWIDARLAQGSVLLPLRRGLSLRLVCARRVPGPERLVLVAERALPREPEAGFLETGFAPAVHALVRWEALGKGLRAPFEAEDTASRTPTFWSLVPLMAEGHEVAARVSLEVDSRVTLEARRDARRRTIAALALALVLAAGALAGRAALAGLVLARGAAFSVCPGWGHAGLHGPAPWARLLEGVPDALARWVHTPVDAAASGLLVAALGVLLARRLRGGTLRGVAAVAGLAALALGLRLVWRVTVACAWNGPEVLLRGPGWPLRALVLAGLCALPAAGAALCGAALAPRRRGAVLGAFAAGAALAGLVQGSATPAAARRLAEQELRPEVAGRTALWIAALTDTLKLTVVPGASDDLVPERDAIDLWWNSPLGERGLAGAVWKFDPGGVLNDSFLVGLPPAMPPPSLVEPPASGVLGPVVEKLAFLGGTSRVLVAAMARPGGGSWVAAVLDEPRNVPGFGRRLGSRALEFAAPAAAETPSPELTPHLAWFDGSGRLVASDLETGPPPPAGGENAPAWRRATIETREADVLEIPDAAGTVALTFFRPGFLARFGLVVDRALFAALLVLAAWAAAAVIRAPREAARAMGRGVVRLATHFRVQVPVFLVAAGLLPLLALGIAGRAVAERQARGQLLNEGARSAQIARRLVEDYLLLGGAERTSLGSGVAAWIARTVGDDLFVWEGGELVATSRPDLDRAGEWPQRIEGAVWGELASGRRAVRLDQEFAVPAGARPSLAVVHAPFQDEHGQAGLLTITLARAGRRIEEYLATVDRALLVSAALLVGLTGLLVTWATRRLVLPLAALERGAGRIASGDFAATIPGTGYEETRALARAFRSMAASLGEQRRSLERRRAAIETLIARLPLAVLAVTPDGRVVAGNPRAFELLGAEPGRALPAHGPDGADAAQDPLRRAVRRLLDRPGEGVDTVERADAGRPHHFRVAVMDLPGLDEHEPARLVMVEDLTDTVRSERLAAWAEMARRIAHEIKNPLTPISLVVEHVRRLIEERDPDLPRTLDRALGTIAEQVRVLKETSREFSDYARLLEARPEPLDLAERLREWLAPYALAPPDGVTFRMDGPAQLEPYAADPRLLRRAVVNLVDNALAAVEHDGTVAVSWGRRESPERALWIAVTDDGPGIAPARLERLFETGETTRETGSGLGLPIALQAAVSHGGRIDVASAPGNTCFTIVLPLAGDTPPDRS